MNSHYDLRAASWAAVACAILALLLPFELIRLVFALPLTLLLPGYAIAAASFVGRPLGKPQLALFSLALSLMTLAIGALLLDPLPGGINDFSWALLLVAVTVGASAVAARRRGPGEGSARFRLALPRVGGAHAVVAAVGAIAVIAALVLAFTTLPAKNALGYSELWMLPQTDGSGVQVGVASQEQEGHGYRLRVAFGNGNAVTEREFALEPGVSRTFGIATHPNARGNPVRVNAVLFRADRPNEIYRRVSGFLPAERASE